MRDLALILFFLAAIPFALKRPYIGALLMAWVGFMNPQTMTWGLARSIPFAAIAFLVCLTSVLLNVKQTRYTLNSTFVTIYIFWAWGAICTIFAFYPKSAMVELVRFTKIQIVLILTILVITDKGKIISLVWAIALSLGFWGVKGGLFALATGGSYRIWGPEKTFIGGNNEVGLAMLMDIPLLYFLFTYHRNKWIKRALVVSMFLCFCAVIFTYSRGAFLGLTAMSLFLWWKSDKKLTLAIVTITLIIVAAPFIPQGWYDRINTIQTYDDDASATGRLNAWAMGFNVANDRPTGGGFRVVSEYTFALYAPTPEDVHDFHSIYFEVIGELGWIGFLLFVIIHGSNWRAGSKLTKRYGKNPDNQWAVRLVDMIKVSLVGYYTGGAFLGLAYWDMPYYLMLIILVLEKTLLDESFKSSNSIHAPS